MSVKKSLKRTKCEIWTRTVGYLRPTNQMHKGKIQEIKERSMFKLNVNDEHNRDSNNKKPVEK